MILIIAEKPSLARNIADAIGNMKRGDGFLYGDTYLVSWAFGHLFSLADIESYTGAPEGTRWSMENLPCFPDEFRFELRRGADKKVDSGVKKQFETLRKLCNREDVDAIVNAGDADREGEIIVRLCIRYALKGEKRLLRLWLPDQTAETIRRALSEMKEERDYDPLADEGFARTYIDWLYGVNLTRYATLKTGTLLRVGRVIIPIVKAIYDRDMAIRNFIPEIYYAIVGKSETGGVPFEVTSKHKFTKDKLAEANALAAAYNAATATVTELKQKKETLWAGKLYSLSKLQNVLAKKYKMSMADSLATVQKLYEEGYLTYPRTNSEYMATAEKDKVRQILAGVSKLGYPVKFKDGKSIFDDSKIESHSALTPTYKIPDAKKLTERERQVYSTVFRRFVAVFCAEECIVSKSELHIAVGDLEEFVLKGTVMLEPGWTKYDDYTQKDKMLPPLQKGDTVSFTFAPAEKQTTPPKHYTTETLNNYLKNPFREEKAAAGDAAGDEEDYRAIFEGLELGTEATRTGIIENAKKSGYIEQKKDVYTILPGGIFLIESLVRMQISMDKYKTSEMGRALKRVYRGDITVKESVALASAEIAEVFRKKEATDDGVIGDTVGTCPLCGNTVRRTGFGYGCAGYRENGCRFSIRSPLCGRVLSLDNVRQLLADGKTEKLSGFLSRRTGKSFDAVLVLKDNDVKFDFGS